MERIFDAHCDTLSLGYEIDLCVNSGQFSIIRAVDAGYIGQVFAAFGQKKICQLKRLSLYEKFFGGAFKIVPAVEGLDEGEDLEDIKAYAELGVKVMSLTWNNDNHIAGGCTGSSVGLTLFGKGVVESLYDFGIIPDLSHASRASFSDLLDIYRHPVCVTHTCCFELTPHRRNLTNEQLKKIAETGGVIGINYYPPFLNPTGTASVGDVVRHIMHAYNICGEDHVGLGSDFDGVDTLPEGINSVRDVPKILCDLPLPGRVKEKISHKNWKRLLF